MIQYDVLSNNMIFIFQNGNVFINILLHMKIFLFCSPEQIRGTADIFYLHPLPNHTSQNSIWFSKQSLSSTIIEQILNRLKLLPDFYNQTKPVETTSNT